VRVTISIITEIILFLSKLSNVFKMLTNLDFILNCRQIVGGLVNDVNSEETDL
jgi:hypothetical protein